MVSRNAVRTESSFGMQTKKTDLENDKSTMPKTFKALQRETTVYKYYIELKEDSLTEQGFLDLVKVPELRIAGVGKFLKNLRLEHHLRQIDIAKIFSDNPRNGRKLVSGWENNRYIPLQSLVKISEALGVSRNTIYSYIDQGIFKSKTSLPAEFEKIREIIKYFSPHKSNVRRRISLIECYGETLSKINSLLRVNTFVTSNCHALINSKELYNYLMTFFQYTEVPKIQNPLTNEVRCWYDNGVDLKRAIICPCLQSDGSIYIGNLNYIIKFCGYNKILHDYFVDAMYYEYNELPSCYFYSSNPEDCCVTIYSQKEVANRVVNDVIKLAGSSKTSPANDQTVEEYLNEPQPHLNYLINAPMKEKQIALRIWASTEGFINMQKTEGRIYPRLGIACAHPKLLITLQQIARELNMNFRKIKSKTKWSGVHGLSTSSLNDCINFLKFGGFIEGVKISPKSKYYEGVSKDVLTLGILELKIRQQTNPVILNHTCEELHFKIKKIIGNKEYKLRDYYIHYFS